MKKMQKKMKCFQNNINIHFNKLKYMKEMIITIKSSFIRINKKLN